MAMSKEKENIMIGIGVVMWIFFIYGVYCLWSPFDQTRGVGLMLAVMILQNWKRNLQAMKS